MEKINGLTNAISEFVTEYADKHELTLNDVMNALAHTFVIYGFAFKVPTVTDDTMEESLVYCVEQSIGFLRGLRDAEKA